MLFRSPVPQVEICCISGLAEARLAIAAGAQALGLASAMPSGPGLIDERLIAEIAAAVVDTSPARTATSERAHAPALPVQTFLLTALQTAAAIVAQHRRCRTTTLQLVDAVPRDELARLREALPDVRLVQVVHVAGEASIAEALAVAPWVDALPLDSGKPALAVKQLGGTGRTHNCAISRRIRESLAALGRPLHLAGGLHAGNVVDAVAAVQPWGLDLCSGLRSADRLDAARLAAFFAALRTTAVAAGLGLLSAGLARQAGTALGGSACCRATVASGATARPCTATQLRPWLLAA